MDVSSWYPTKMIDVYGKEVIYWLSRDIHLNANNIVITSQFNGLSGQYNIYIHDTISKRYYAYDISRYFNGGTKAMTVALLIVLNYVEVTRNDNKVR